MANERMWKIRGCEKLEDVENERLWKVRECGK